MKKSQVFQFTKTETSGGSAQIFGPFTYSMQLNRPIKILSIFCQGVYRNAALASPSVLQTKLIFQALGESILTLTPGSSGPSSATSLIDQFQKVFGGPFGDGTTPILFRNGLYVPVCQINFIVEAWTSIALNDTVQFTVEMEFEYVDNS